MPDKPISQQFDIQWLIQVLGLCGAYLEKIASKEATFYLKDLKATEEELLTFFEKKEKTEDNISITVSMKLLGRIGIKLKKMFDLEQFRVERQEHFDKLTKQEKIILAWVAEGLSTEEIATNLFVSPNTVRAHRRAINKKLGIKHFKDILQFAQAFDLV